MATAKKRTITSSVFSSAEIGAAKKAAPVKSTGAAKVNWSSGIVTRGGGVAATIAALRRSRGPGKKPRKEQVAIRLDREVVGAFRAGGPGWQTRMNAALKEWLAERPVKRKTRSQRAV
jgi:uncharacterized protein (DUF4415 family)